MLNNRIDLFFSIKTDVSFSFFSQSKRFSKQVEDLCQHILKKTSVVSTAEAQEIIISIIQALLLAEKCLKNIQEADLKVKQQVFWSLPAATLEELYSLKKEL